MKRTDMETMINNIYDEINGVRAQLNCIGASLSNTEAPPDEHELEMALMGSSSLLKRIMVDLDEIANALVKNQIEED